MKTSYLSKEERQKGVRHYLNWASLNGFGFSFLGDTTVYLMAIHFGASNTQLGYLSAMAYMSGLVLLIVPRLLAGVNLVTIHFYAWIIRGVICLFYGLLFFLQGEIAISLILDIHTLFCIARTFGVAVSSPIQQTISTAATTGEIVVRTSNRFQTTRFISQFLSFLILSVKEISGILGYLILVGIGVIVNTLSAFSLKHIPCREVVEYRRGQNIFVIFFQSLKNRERALTLFVKWHTLSIVIIFTFMVPFLRKFVHLPSNVIFLYTLVGTLATVSASYMLRPFTDRIGSRPVLILTSFILVFLSILWSVTPITFHWSVFFVLGFFTTFCQGLLLLLSSRLELKSIPKNHKIGYVSMMNFFSAVISLIVGLLAGMLADVGESAALPILNPYGFTFLLGAVLSAQNGVLSLFLQDTGSLSVKETTNILFSNRNLRAFLDVYQFNMTEDPIKRRTTLLSIGKSDTMVAAHEIRRILKNPLSTEKEDVLKSLFAYPKPALLPDILEEAAREYSYYRLTAIFALGAYPVPEVETFLLRLLEHPSSDVRSSAAKSLARIGNTSALSFVRQQAQDDTLDVSDRLNYQIALCLMDRAGEHLERLFQSADHQKGEIFEQSVLALTSRIFDFTPPLSDLYQEENLRPGAGLEQLLEDAKQLTPFFEHEALLLEYYQQGKYPKIWQWCCENLPRHVEKERYGYLAKAIHHYDIREADKTATLAALYFTYQIILARS
ncbi:putative membrane protein [Candidatus Vecturithrix granuli]|uniref:Putative membrane protein n=1 Tax=Vecturithrix granuli TaxID=1499967 RepID=A0A081C9W8_VECG1|nr:putative membrane protein [Candidatus Vecturithrix granuli]